MVWQPVIPKRRHTAHVETLRGELCVYEWTTRTVHALNPAAARVWELCDGNMTIEEMAAAVRRDLNAPGATAIVEHALTQFDRAGLLEPGTLAGAETLLSRRTLLRRIGVAAAIPVVTSIVAPAPLAAQSGSTVQFNPTGAPQSFTVPAGITSVQVDVLGGSAPGVPSNSGGPGGRVQATLPVTPGETLTIVVGNSGTTTPGVQAFNGGGAGTDGGFGGGGASDIRRSTTRLIVAGGGGAGGTLVGGNGGAGGGLIGGAGTGFCGGGGGGTQSAGGAGGSGSGTAGSPGTSGTGGQGAAATPPGNIGASGGGGGFFGGGGGGACVTPGGAAGGGGSSFTDPSATGVVHTQGFGGIPRIIVSW